MMDKILDTAIGQFLGLVTFFAFPAFQYLSLKLFAKNEGHPQLWYLPKFGFRLVIRNLPGKRTLSDIKHRALLRKVITSSSGASVATYQDELLLERDDFFLFPGNDQVLVSFNLDGKDDALYFVLTDKLGKEKKRILLDDFDRLICDYVATVENTLNFDIKLAKRAEMESTTLRSIWKKLKAQECSFPIDRIRNVG
jgi:hypothetical protein